MLYVKCSDGDVLGDGWSAKIRRVWEKMVELEELDQANLRRASYRWSDGLVTDEMPLLTSKGGVYETWQWMMCKAAGCESRIVASPQALAYANVTIPSNSEIAQVIELSDRAIQRIGHEWQVMQKSWTWGGVPFYEIPLDASEFMYHREELRKDRTRMMASLSLACGSWNQFLADCACGLGVRGRTQQVLIDGARSMFCTKGGR